ncbi:sigma-70 family RNA polymerase sigma factor [Aeromicrobium terrae]|uniref:sigma-70 family RNA polymerase sigma factor n=1 Tax=Aeromicrobium terrae TaxID=2498846 RepID=UPI00164EE930|nr:sigma-70 family RNA polymerase sigma factor [Aeromicrobium terrae]
MSDVVEGQDASAASVELDDAALISAVRSGDTAAYGTLFDRHRDAATRLARQLSPSDADDLVAESFTRVLALLQDGKGPELAFRAYLLTAVRRLHVDRVRSTAKVRPTDDDVELDRPTPSADRSEIAFESAAAAAAYAALPERWQMVLWHLDVEGEKPAAVAPLLGMSPNGVSALAYRAREGLRQSYLQHHLSITQDADCRSCTSRLAAYVRRGLSARAGAEVEAHLDHCRRCTGLYLELIEVNRDLGGMLVPAVLGVSATGYLTAAAAAGAAGVAGTAAGAVGIKVVLSTAAKAMVEPVKAAGTALGPSGVAASAVVATVATAGIVTVATQSKDVDPPPAAVASSPAPTATPEASPSPTPEPSPSEEALVVPLPTPSPTLTPEPVVEEPAATETPEPEPTVEPPPVGVTDFGIGTATVSRDTAFWQRRVTVPVTAHAEPHPVARTVSLRVDFDRRERFRGTISPGWACNAAVGQRLRSVTCTATLAPGEGGTLVFRVLGLSAPGTARVTAPDDPDPANDARRLVARLGLLAL